MKTETISLLSQITRKFCESTSLHGYSYIANTNSIIVKIIWSVVILCFSTIGVKFLIVNTHEYMESRLVTSIESSSASLKVSWRSKKILKSWKWSRFNSSIVKRLIVAIFQEVTFPSITVCNLNRVEASYLKDIGYYGDSKATKTIMNEFMFGRNGNLSQEEKDIINSLYPMNKPFQEASRQKELI